MDIKIMGININYIDEGEGNTVLLLHGWGSSLDVWRPYINALKHKLRFVALDFPGCGKSDLPQNPLTTQDYANLVLEFVEKLDLKDISLVGHSHGGRTIMKLVGDKMISPRRIIFCDAAGIKPKKDIKKELRVATYKTIRKTLSLPIVRNYTKELLEKARSHFGSADYKNAPEVMRKTLVNLVNDDLTDKLSNINCPTFLIWGDNDTATPLYMAHIIEQHVKDTGLCIYEGAGHFSFAEQPGRTIAIFDSFLS